MPQTRHSKQAQHGFVNGAGFVVLMGLLTAFDPLSIDMYLPAFPSIQRDFATTYSAVELSLTSFFIGMALGQLVYGPAADRYGRKRPLLAGMGIYMAATLGCAFSTNVGMLIALRALQAFGGCAGMVVTRAVVRDLFDKRRSAQFFSSMVLVMGLAPILAPTIGGYVNAALGWRAIFFLLAALNLLCLLAIVALLPETLPPSGRRRLPARSVLAAYGALARTASFIGFVIPDAAIRAGMFAYIAGSPFVFMEIFRVPPQHYGWIFASNALGLISASQANRLLLKRAEPERILRFTLPLSALAAATLFFLPQLIPTFWAVVVPLFLFVMSLGFVGPNSIAGAMAHQGHQAGMASALYGTFQWSIAALSSMAVSRLHNGTLYPMTGVIFGCGVVSSLAFQLLVVRRSSFLSRA